MERIGKISSEMARLQEQKNEALRMKLRGEVDLQTYRTVTRELDAAHDQLAREHEHLTSEAAMPELPDPSLAWEDLSSDDRGTLTELLVAEIVIKQHPSETDANGSRHHTLSGWVTDHEVLAPRVNHSRTDGSGSHPDTALSG